MTRAQLLSIFERYLKRADLQDLYADFLTMATARLNKTLRLSEMEYRSTSTPTDAFWALPQDFLEMRHIEAQVAGGPRPLDYVTPDSADLARRRLNGGSGLTYYTIQNGGIELIPHPSAESETVVEMFYFGKLQPLVADADTNPVLTEYPNIYLYCLLFEAALYRADFKQQQSWKAAFDNLASDLNLQAERSRYNPENLAMRAV